MLHRIALVFAVTLSVAQPVASQEGGITLMGNLDCGTWLQARMQKTSVPIEQYLQGLVNGMSLGSGIEFWNAGGVKVTTAQVLHWMDNYCRRDPLSGVVAGAVSLIDERTGNAWSKRFLR